MFKEPFNFALRRTGLQALGWYLVFFAIAGILGAIAGILFASSNSAVTFDDGVKAGMLAGKYLAPAFPIVVGLPLVWTRPLSALNVIVALLAIAVGLLLGWVGAGILLAYLTTRPPRERYIANPVN